MRAKRRKVMGVCDDELQGGFHVLPYRLTLDILGYAIVSVDISHQNAIFQLIGRFSRDIFRTQFLIFRAVRIFSGHAVNYPKIELFLPYVLRPDQFIYAMVHPKFWYKLVSMLERHDLTKVNLREVCICGPRNTRGHSLSWGYVINTQLLRSMTNLHTLRLCCVVLTNELRTEVRRVSLHDVQFAARLVAPQCTALQYSSPCTVHGADIHAVAAPLVYELKVFSHQSLVFDNSSSGFIPHEDDLEHVVRWTEHPVMPQAISIHKIVDFTKIMYLSIALPCFTENEQVDLGEFVSLQLLIVRLSMCCCVLLPRHELQVVEITKGYANYSGPDSHFCTYCGGGLQEDGKAISHVHGQIKVVWVVKFNKGRIPMLDNCPSTERISFVDCEFADNEDIEYTAKVIYAKSCTGLLRVDCDNLRLRDCSSLRWEGRAECEYLSNT